MWALIDALIDLVESAIADIEAEGLSSFGSGLKKAASSSKKRWSPINKMLNFRNKIKGKALKGAMLGNKLKSKLMNNAVTKLINTIDNATLKINAGKFTKAKKLEILSAISEYKATKKLSGSMNAANYEAKLDKAAKTLNKSLGNKEEDTGEIKIDDKVEFAKLTSSWLVFGVWRQTSKGEGRAIGNISLTTKKGYTFTLNHVSRELWFLMKNATGKFGHWYAPKGAGSWYWNYLKNGMISSGGMEMEEVKKHFAKTINAKGMLAIIMKRRR